MTPLTLNHNRKLGKALSYFNLASLNDLKRAHNKNNKETSTVDENAKPFEVGSVLLIHLFV